MSIQRQNLPYPTPSLVESFFDQRVQKVLDEANLEQDQISGLSIVTPFELWSWTDEFGASVDEMLAWKDYDLKASLEKRFSWRVIIENDGTAACRAELLFGNHKDKRDWIYFYIGTFVGGGLVLDSKLLAGRRGNAGGFGPMRVPSQEGGDRLIDHASLVVLERSLVKAEKTEHLPLNASKSWQAYRPHLTTWIERAAHSMAHAIVSSLSIIDFEGGVVIDGALPESVKAELVQAVIKQLAIIDVQGIEPPNIEAGQIGPVARLKGAAAAQIDAMFS